MKVVKRILIFVAMIVIAFASYLTAEVCKMYNDAIGEKPIEEMVSELRNKYDYTKINEIPDMYKKAVVAVEDHRFYNHSGVDILSIGRAAINDIKAMKFVEGGSTITQQLCKNIYFTQEKKITRKIAEVFMAWKLESVLKKDEILELYINTSYYGSGYYGIKQASIGYFNKMPNELNDNECTILAGIPNAPSIYSLDNNTDLAIKRQKQVIQSMVKYKMISEDEARKITDN